MRAMTSPRRSAYARHELRFGTRELTVAALAVLLVCGLAFAGGLFLGREMGAPRGGRAEAGRAAGVPEAGRAAGTPTDSDEDVTRSGPRLTFYKTLTAPTVESAAPRPPIVEERIIPKADAGAAPKTEPRAAAAPAPPPPPTSPPGRSPSGAVRAEAPPRPRGTVPPGPTTEASAARGAAAPAAEPQLWTIQVSSFRTRALADDLRARLTTRGFDAYLVSVATEEGRVRYRVRVGTFASRPEAERVTGELRSERNLSPFVTPKGR